MPGEVVEMPVRMRIKIGSVGKRLLALMVNTTKFTNLSDLVTGLVTHYSDPVGELCLPYNRGAIHPGKQAEIDITVPPKVAWGLRHQSLVDHRLTAGEVLELLLAHMLNPWHESASKDVDEAIGYLVGEWEPPKMMWGMPFEVWEAEFDDGSLDRSCQGSYVGSWRGHTFPCLAPKDAHMIRKHRRAMQKRHRAAHEPQKDVYALYDAGQERALRLAEERALRRPVQLHERNVRRRAEGWVSPKELQRRAEGWEPPPREQS